ncbi:MAG: hypothetical protein IJ220_04680 [Clostridia bacterium]|nr:hypothetical protein [Clostridia bacterium]
MEKGMLNVIFEARLEDIAHTTEMDKEFLHANCHSTEIYDELEAIINKSCGKEADSVLHTLDDFIEDLNVESGYFNEKYYKQGFIDGLNVIKLIFQKGSP